MESDAAGQVEWRFCGPECLPYTGTFRSKAEIVGWLASIPEVDDIQAFEPREGTRGTPRFSDALIGR